MSEPRLSHPGVRFPPPLLFLGGLALAAFLQARWPLPLVGMPRPAGLLALAYGLFLAGIAWTGWGLLTFRRARTTIFPNQPASTLVTAGPYRYGRNPMYVGLSAVYWGITLWLNTLWAVLLFPAVIALLLRFVIRREERYLTDAFAEEYDRYCSRVPRWLSTGRARDGRDL